MQDDRQEQRRRLVEQMKRQLGPVLWAALDDPTVKDVMLNPDGKVLVDRVGDGMTVIGEMNEQAAMMFIGTVAALAGAVVNHDNPVLECKLHNGARFESLTWPIVSSPVFCIRCHAKIIFALDDYVRDKIMTPRQREIIGDSVYTRKNILVCGGTGTGKTTLGNALSQETADVDPNCRVIILEDTPELQCPVKNVVTLMATSDVSHRTLLKATMRLRPDRIIVGEVRGGEALDMLKAWNTGHEGGFCTVHANHARAGLTRIEQLIAEVSVTPMQDLIAEAIDLIVSIVRVGTGRRIKEVCRVNGYDKTTGQYRLEFIGE